MGKAEILIPTGGYNGNTGSILTETIANFQQMRETPEGREELLRRIKKGFEIYAQTARSEPSFHVRFPVEPRSRTWRIAQAS